MISEYKQWWIALVTGVLLGAGGIIIGILAWQYPQSPPSDSAPGEEVYIGLKRYNQEVKYEEFKKKYIHTFDLSSDQSVGWVDTGLVLKRNQKIYVSTNENSPSSNYWAVLTNRWDEDKGCPKTYSNRWQEQGDGFDIDTNDILGDKKEDTLKLAAYWYDKGMVTVDVITNLDNYYAERAQYGEECPY
jgi:hypothetical protein